MIRNVRKPNRTTRFFYKLNTKVYANKYNNRYANVTTTHNRIIFWTGIHAREWISSAVALYILRQLVENKSYRKLVSDVDWYILPMINADGYEYSHTVDRLWRKSRRTSGQAGRYLSMTVVNDHRKYVGLFLLGPCGV